MRPILTLDIETIPVEEFLVVPDEEGKSPPGPIWDDYPTDEWWYEKNRSSWQDTEEAFQRWLEDEKRLGSVPHHGTGQLLSCHPVTARVASLSTGVNPSAGKAEPQIQIVQLDDTLPKIGKPGKERSPTLLEALKQDGETCWLDVAERVVIEKAFAAIKWATGKGVPIVTFNGKGFDLPMLRWRAAILGVEIPKVNWYEMLYRYRHKEHQDLRLVLSDGDTRAKGTLEMWCRTFGIEAESSGSQVLEWALEGKWDEIRRYGEVEMQSLTRFYRALEPYL